MCAIALAMACAPGVPASATAYTFGEPSVRAAGPEVAVFDWTTQKCASDDIPDQPTRAFRDASGQVTLINSHHTVRRYIGPSLDSVVHKCNILMGSGKSPDPSLYDNREWLATTYTTNGTTVHGLIHSEYQGWNYGPGYCIRPGELHEEKIKCWYNALTLTTSTNGGASFAHTAPPTHYVAGPPYRYAAGIGPIGYFQPSNIVRAKDGYYYVLAHVEDYGEQPLGTCVLRTRSLDDPASWRMWSGTGFNRRFRDPHLHDYPPAEGVCAPVSFPHIGTLSQSLTWSTYLKKWVLVGHADNADGVSGPGFYYFTSDDLINWGPAKLLMRGELPWTHTCADGPEQLRDPSVLDRDSSSRNFETIGQRPYLYFTRFNMSFSSTSCWTSLDRDLIRIPLEFSNQQPGGPTAVLSASSVSVRPGRAVTFDASRSRDDDGSIVRHEWDLDGDGTYERDTGSEPVTRRAYEQEQAVTVTVRVSDDDGKATDETVLVRVSEGSDDELEQAPAPAQPAVAGPGATAATIGRVAVPRVVRGGRRGAVVRVLVPAAGVLRLRPPAGRTALRPARASAAAPGRVALRVRPSRKGRDLLRRRGRLRVRALLSFTPVGGAAQTATVLIVFHAR